MPPEPELQSPIDSELELVLKRSLEETAPINVEISESPTPIAFSEIKPYTLPKSTDMECSICFELMLLNEE